MSIKHHLNDALLMAYSAGTLPEAFNIVVATHISMCDDCRAALEGFDALGGAFLEDSAILDAGAEMDADALASTMALIDTIQQENTVAPKADAVFPQPLQDYVGGDLGAVKWRSVGGGVRQAILPTSKDATVRLIRIPPGMSVPDHGHRGMELTLVLQGAFRDEYDRFGRGDIEVADEDLNHTPVAEEGMDCICLAATDAPLRFNAFLPRVAQKFLRI